MDEFAFIDQYLKSTKAPPAQAPLILGIGDDAATFKIAAHRYWHMSVDTLVEGKHFFSND
ncbi:MAG: thiamine-phosphate kinase, partial [Haemophilus parainfluenzae]